MKTGNHENIAMSPDGFATPADTLRAAFLEQGFVSIAQALPPAVIADLDAATNAILSSAPADPKIGAQVDWESELDPHGKRRAQRVRNPQTLHRAFDALARSPGILDYVRPLLGPDIRLHHAKINIKPPHIGTPLEWHQDWAFIPHSHPGLAIVAICLDDCYGINGPVAFIPGSHRGPLHSHHHGGVFYGAIDPAAIDTTAAVEVTGPAGTLSIHHPMTVHGSGFNRGDRDRRILFLEYAAADAWPLFYGVDWPEYESRMVCGQSSPDVRVEPVPVRMPYPSSTQEKGRIYDQQRAFAKRYFTKEAPQE
jgi:ectoine hydroxylase-related dioxygenase (phytanoyl-CoA dioxygenase family)